MSRLQRQETLLLVVDVQEKLMPVIDRADDVAANVERLVRGFHVLDIPALLTEQYVKGLGRTIPRVRRAFEETSGYTPIEKASFSAKGEGEFVAALRGLRKKQIVVCGVETHVCVYQSVSDLLAAGYDVTIAADGVSSRTAENKATALERMTRDGARLSSTEMVLFELLNVSGTDEFAQILRLVK
jgi:nicotinamidase-related amidase